MHALCVVLVTLLGLGALLPSQSHALETQVELVQIVSFQLHQDSIGIQIDNVYFISSYFVMATERQFNLIQMINIMKAHGKNMAALVSSLKPACSTISNTASSCATVTLSS